MGIQDRLEDLDDKCLLSHSFSDMQSKLNVVSESAKIAILEIDIHKIKTLNANAEEKFLLYGKKIDDVVSFCYLDSVIRKFGASLANVANCRINKARNAFV